MLPFWEQQPMFPFSCYFFLTDLGLCARGAHTAIACTQSLQVLPQEQFPAKPTMNQATGEVLSALILLLPFALAKLYLLTQGC